MLGVNQLDFINYTTALKGNYRKGVHKLEAILANPTHAAEFAANLGGVSVVLGVPIGKEDKNSEALLSLLLASSVADDAVYTWLGQFYEFTSWDDLLGDAGRCQEMMADPFIWRAMASSGVAVGKSVATLAGLDCSAYADMTAVAASQTAMAAVTASPTAMAAIATSSMATAKYAASAAGLNPADYADMTALAASSTAMTAVAASQTAMATVIANTTALNAVVASSTAMTAVAASYIAVAAIYGSTVAVDTVKANGTAWSTLTGATSAVMGKAVAILAGLNPDSYADMTAVAASQTAMAAVAASTTAATAIEASSTAVSALSSSPLKVTDSGGYGHTNNKRTVRSGRAFIISVKFGNSSNTSYYGNISTFLLGSSSYRTTCTASARAINRFATSIVCYGEYTSSLNDNVNYSQVVYIPC